MFANVCTHTWVNSRYKEVCIAVFYQQSSCKVGILFDKDYHPPVNIVGSCVYCYVTYIDQVDSDHQTNPQTYQS